MKKAHELVTTGSTGQIRLSLRNGFTAYSALSLVTGLCCHHHQRDAQRHHFSAMRSIVTSDARTSSPI
jgi:hypothetical protein